MSYNTDPNAAPVTAPRPTIAPSGTAGGSAVARPVVGGLATMLQMRDEIAAARKKAQPVEPNTVVRFTVALDGKTYNYAAIFAGGRWHTTANQPGVVSGWMTHKAFIEFLATDERVIDVDVASQFESFTVGEAGS